MEQKRCRWAEGALPYYQKYHDEEWGVPEYEDKALFELLILEGFQSGLSWATILKKRDAFRVAFDGFNPHVVAKYTEDKIQALMQCEGIVRNQSKIRSAVSNAQVFLQIQQEFGSFAKYIWGFTEGLILTNTTDQFATTSPLSDTISKDLKKRGMKYVGSTIVYSYLQAIGVIHDHERDCFCYRKP